MPPPQTVKIFCSYAHKDEPLREELDPHFALLRHRGVATYWTDREIYAGSHWAEQIDHNLRTANLILLLLSPHFFNSKYCCDIELKLAAARHLRGEADLIPIILQPCMWETYSVECDAGRLDLGKLQALPAEAKPVIKWGKRQEVCANIVEGVTAVIERRAGGVARGCGQTGAPPTHESPTPPVPDLLPYLCNRATQEVLLRRAVQQWRASGLVKRPLVCVVHGGDDEAIDMFKRRLHEVTLPAILSARAGRESELLYDSALGRIDDIFVPLPRDYIEPLEPFEFLQAEVGRPVADNMYASPQTVAEALSAKDVPTFFHSHLASGSWNADGERIVDAYLDFWRSLPDVKAGRVLSFLFFKYNGVGENCPPPLAKLNARAEKFFKRLGARLADYKGAHALVLPRLPPVAQSDAETWVRNREHFFNLCDKHPLRFCKEESAVEEIERIFTGHFNNIPMERLAPLLHAVITNHRCGGAGRAA